MEITDNKKQILPQSLLAQIAEELKTPLAQVARLSEAGLITNTSTGTDLKKIKLISESALKLVDDYTLALRLANLEADSLAVEPLAAGAILAQVMKEIKPVADIYKVKVEMNTSGNYLPVLANRQVLTTALTSIGRSLTEMIAIGSDQQTLQLKLKKYRGDVEIGWYWTSDERIDVEILSRGRDILGKSRQPLAAVTNGSVSGIFMADYILGAMDYRLHSSKLDNLRGLAVNLRTSKQLAFI